MSVITPKLRYTFHKRALLLLLFFLTVSASAFAGGFMIHENTVYFNGQSCKINSRLINKINFFQNDTSLYPNLPLRGTITMDYYADNYSFSGGLDHYEYVMFEFRNVKTNEIFYAIQEVRRYQGGNGMHSAGYQLSFRMKDTGVFEISYYMEPAFFRKELPNLEYHNVFTETEKHKYWHANVRGHRKLCQIRITDDTPEIQTNLSLYLRINGETPGLHNITAITKNVRFNFVIKNQTIEKNLLFRYRLAPDDTWSEWQTDNFADYYFIAKGYHEFEVQCQYEVDNTRRMLGLARYAFTLDNPFVSRPNGSFTNHGNEDKSITFIDKGDVKRRAPNANNILSQVYDRNNALIIGIRNFRDPGFGILPYLDNDTSSMAAILRKMHFNVHVSKNISRTPILNDIRKELSVLRKNDRLIIYVSSHGFIDHLDGKAKIATAECQSANPVDAIGIDDLKDMIKGVSSNCRHILLVLDCCASGLGVIEKNNAIGAMRSLATQRGTAILTAGMSDQNAKMDPKLHMSVFTHYLIDGLTNKHADYTGDHIITLTELLIYVQYNVANYTNSQQIPMSGRISGSGEMIFY